ncbi:MAG: hypothetical protein WCI53_03285 [Bacteroidota bacterium]
MLCYSPLNFLKKSLILALFFSFFNLNAQNQIGLNTTIFAGVNALQINPANICNQPFNFDLNILGLDLNLNNNHFYTEPLFLLSLPFNNNLTGIEVESKGFTPSKLSEGELLIKKNIQQNGYVFGSVAVHGPTFLIALNNKKSIAFTSSLKSNFSALNVSNLTATTIFEGPSYPTIIYKNLNFKDTKFSFATWLEFGISYAQVIKEERKYLQRFGFTFKGLFALGGGYILDRGFDGFNEDGRDLIFKNSSFNYAYAGLSKNINPNNIKINGIGSSLDLGYSIEKKNNAGIRNCPNFYGIPNDYINYKWRFGFSLFDIGAIAFFNNASKTEINNGSMRWVNYDNYLKNLDVNQVDSIFRVNIVNTTPIVSNSYWLIMPACVSIQFDYQIYKNFYTNLVAFQRLTLPQTPSLSRMNTIAFIPRIEKQKWNICMPVILNEYKDFNLGLSARYKFFTIGSDRFLESFGFIRSYGTNIYFSIKYSIEK